MNKSTSFQPVGSIVFSGILPRRLSAFFTVWGGQMENLLIIQSIIRYKHQKHFNQFTKSLLFCVILFYRFFLVSAAALRSTTVGSEPTSTGRCEPVGTEQRSTGPLVPLYFPLSEFVNLYGKR